MSHGISWRPGPKLLKHRNKLKIQPVQASPKHAHGQSKTINSLLMSWFGCLMGWIFDIAKKKEKNWVHYPFAFNKMNAKLIYLWTYELITSKIKNVIIECKQNRPMMVMGASRPHRTGLCEGNSFGVNRRQFTGTCNSTVAIAALI